MLSRFSLLLCCFAVVLDQGCAQQSPEPSETSPQTPSSANPTPAPTTEEEAPTEEATKNNERAGCTDEPSALAEGEAAPYALLRAGSDYVWTTSVNGKSKIRRWRGSTGKVETLSSRQRQVGALAVRGSEVFFAEVSYTTANDPGQVVKISLTNKKTTTVAAGADGEVMDDFSIAADADALYWLTHDPTTLEQHVWRLGNDAALPVQIGFVKLPVDQNISRLRVDGRELYWATASGWAYRLSTAGGTPELVVDDADGIAGWDVRRGVLAYADLGANGGLHLVQASGGTTPVVAQAHARLAVTLTDDSIFYATDTALHKVERSGGPEARIVGDAASVGSIVIDDDELAWAETKTTAGTVRAMCLAAAKPIEPEPACPIEFANAKLCASLTWSSGPKKQASNSYRLRFWAKGKGRVDPIRIPLNPSRSCCGCPRTATEAQHQR